MSQPDTVHRLRRRALHAADRPHRHHYRHRDFGHDDHRLERLIRRLPQHRQGPVRWLRSPAARWVRLPLGVLFILGSLLFILPIFGLWMLPVGLLLLAEDVPPLRRLRTRILNWIERHRPHWFFEHHKQVAHQQVPHNQLTDKEETT